MLVDVFSEVQNPRPWQEGNFDALRDQDSLIVGSPQTCRKKLRMYADLGIDRLMCFHQVGQLPHDAVMKSIRLIGGLIPELDTSK